MNHLDTIVATLAGLGGGFLVAFFFYRIQRREGRASERRLATTVAERSDSLAHTVATVEAQVATVAAQLSSHPDDVLTQPRGIGSPSKNIIAALLKAPPPAGPLSIEALRAIHRALFPQKWPGGGEIRSIDVWLGPPGCTAERAVYQPPGPEDVESMLVGTIEEWNGVVDSLRAAAFDAQVAAVARLHYGILAAHPFADGNGTVARLLLSAQLLSLSGKFLDPTEVGDEYAKALTLANRGDVAPLIAYIRARCA